MQRTADLKPLTIAAAPEGSRPILEAIQKAFGFVPNLMATFASSPALLAGYTALDAAWEKGTFSAADRQLVLLAASVVNECGYCVAAHSTVAKKFLHVPAETVAAVRAGRTLGDARQNALVKLTREIVDERGSPSAGAIDAFLAAGYRQDQVLELLLGVALKTISNYAYHITGIELDPAFAGER